MNTQIITVTIQKGGTGKTTTCAALAQAAASRGLKVLAIDLDPQANLSFALDAPEGKAGAYELLEEGAAAADLIQTTPQGLDVITGSRDLATISTGRGSARRLQLALIPLIGRYDLIFIDGPAKEGELLYNALQASTGVIIPSQTDIFNLGQGLAETTEAVDQIKDSNPFLEVLGLIVTRYDSRSTHSKQLHEMLIEAAAARGIPYLGTVRISSASQEAITLQQSLYTYAPRSAAAISYMQILDKITESSGA